MTKAMQIKDYVKKLLQECKTLGGLCTTDDQQCHILIQKLYQVIVILIIEMAFFAHSPNAKKLIFNGL